MESAPTDPVKRTVWTFGQRATLELTQYVFLFCNLVLLSVLIHFISHVSTSLIYLPNTVATGAQKMILNSKVTIMGTQTLVVLVCAMRIHMQLI